MCPVARWGRPEAGNVPCGLLGLILDPSTGWALQAGDFG